MVFFAAVVCQNEQKSSSVPLPVEQQLFPAVQLLPLKFVRCWSPCHTCRDLPSVK